MSSGTKAVANVVGGKRKAVDSTGSPQASVKRAQKASVVAHKRSSLRQILARTASKNKALHRQAWESAQRETKTAWHNWAVEMANMALHLVCTYADRMWPAVERKQVSAETVFAQARAALDAFGSYDGLQPHVQSNDKIFECALRALDDWRICDFDGQYLPFLTHLRAELRTGALTTNKRVQELREKCRICTPEPRLYAGELRRLEKRSASQKLGATDSDVSIARRRKKSVLQRKRLPSTLVTEAPSAQSAANNRTRLNMLIMQMEE